MRKIFFILILILILSCEVFAQTGSYLMDYPKYRNITDDNIQAVKVRRYTEAGMNEKTIKDKTEINEIYKLFKQIKVLDETKYSCTDNTTIYVFKLDNGSEIPAEIECEWVVIDGRNYNFEVKR